MIDRYRQAKQAAARTVLESKTSGLGGVRWGAVDLDWGHCPDGGRNTSRISSIPPTCLPSNEEARRLGSHEVDSSITQAEVTEVVRKLPCSGKAPGVDEIRPEYLKSLDVVGLSWLTRLCNIAWRLGTVPLVWQTGVVVPLFKKGDRRVCSNYRGITLLSLPREGLTPGYWREFENSADSRTLGFRRNNAVFVLVVEHWTSSIPSTGCLRVYGSLPNQSTCALWIWRRHSTVSLVVFCGGAPLTSMGSGSPLLRAVRSLYDRSRSLVRIAGSKSDLFPVHVGLRQGLPFVTGPVHNLYGQDF
ncbi:hypothetical protein L3Q82_013500 [Scortum barcoo]|uniref:Uncharacterized protein n=1 Tax=Scortum barcoo TaxID=214431 RepID=A0ACB8W0W3_9TELE|nr:hypothetical protein L3Q82_013500 [Scortum barcoo]